MFVSIDLTWLAGATHRLGGLTRLAGVVVAWARAFFGVHFPLDMLGHSTPPTATGQVRSSIHWNSRGPNHALPINRMIVRPTFQARIITVASSG